MHLQAILLAIATLSSAAVLPNDNLLDKSGKLTTLIRTVNVAAALMLSATTLSSPLPAPLLLPRDTPSRLEALLSTETTMTGL